MEITAELKELLTTVLNEKFPAEMISEISLDDVTVDQEAGEIRIVLTVSTQVEPEDFADQYFGLTHLMQRKFRDRSAALSNFFPIITPVFGQGAHA
jgi:hypothetical protein